VESVTGSNLTADALLETAARRWFDDLADRGILVTDRELVVRAWNSWLVAQTGVSSDEALGRPLVVLVPTIATRGLDEHYRRALEGEVRVLAQPFHKFLIPVAKSALGAVTGDPAQTARIVPLTVSGRVVGTITIIEDVSERLMSERELRDQIQVSERARTLAEDASKLKDEFLATMSHEIRTPLNAVLGWTQILRTQSNVQSRERGLEVIERNASSQLRLVEDLLDMARIISGKLRLDIRAIDLRTIVQAALDVVEPGAAAKQVSMVTRFEDSTVPVNADADRLQQAIWNVLSNALKFTDAGGTISVTLTSDISTATVSVSDTGQGIGADFLPYVFDRFRQADGSTSRRHGGLGLGLALTRQIVELHGGFIGAKSAGVGKGAEFSIRLPLADALAQVSVTNRSSLTASALAGLTVLIVDDSTDSREMFEVALRAYGASVVALDSSQEALAILESGEVRPDILLSDIGLPGSDGYDLIRHVRALPAPTSSVPAIAITAYADPEDRIQALAAGYQLHLPKPTEPSLVAESILALTKAARGRG
jgi:signal transduction histidine kinase/ActR/RegA family two-component response regulator